MDLNIKKSPIVYYDIKIYKCMWENKQSLMVIFTNISEKKQAKILKEIDGYKDDILSTVSHDLKTPLNGILTMLSSAAKSNDFNDL